MIRMSTKVKVAAAYNLLKKYNIYCYVLGCHDISSAEQAVKFADNPDKFYKDRA